MVLTINLTLIFGFGIVNLLKYDIEGFDEILWFLVVVRPIHMIGLSSFMFFVCKEAAFVSDLEKIGKKWALQFALCTPIRTVLRSGVRKREKWVERVPSFVGFLLEGPLIFHFTRLHIPQK